jgi:N-acetylmuramoyl-L-alanine amidase
VFADREAREAERRALDERSVACLARNVYFEARGEPLAGQYAVAEVTVNRRGWGPFRRTVCEVVYAPGAFSWTAQRRLPDPAGPAWVTAQQVADAVYWRRHVPTLHGARYYHAVYVNPDWAREKRRVTRIGKHIFYR